jgi:hypothetical protein
MEWLANIDSKCDFVSAEKKLLERTTLFGYNHRVPSPLPVSFVKEVEII